MQPILLQYSGLLFYEPPGPSPTSSMRPQKTLTDEPRNNAHTRTHTHARMHVRPSVNAAAWRKQKKNTLPSSTRFDWNQAKHFYTHFVSTAADAFPPTTPPPLHSPCCFFFLVSDMNVIIQPLLPSASAPTITPSPGQNSAEAPLFRLFKYLICKQP